MVLHLADRLEVPLRERNRLLLAAGYAPVFRERPLDDRRWRRCGGARAVPGRPRAVPRRRRRPGLEPRARERGVDALAAGVAPELLEPPANVLRAALHPDGMAPHIVNFAEWSGHLLHRLRRQIALTGDDGLARLYDEVAALPGRATWSRRRPAAQPRSSCRCDCRDGDAELSFFSTVTTFGTPVEVTLVRARRRGVLSGGRGDRGAPRALTPPAPAPAEQRAGDSEARRASQDTCSHAADRERHGSDRRIFQRVSTAAVVRPEPARVVLAPRLAIDHEEAVGADCNAVLQGRSAARAGCHGIGRIEQEGSAGATQGQVLELGEHGDRRCLREDEDRAERRQRQQVREHGDDAGRDPQHVQHDDFPHKRAGRAARDDELEHERVADEDETESEQQNGVDPEPAVEERASGGEQQAECTGHEGVEADGAAQAADVGDGRVERRRGHHGSFRGGRLPRCPSTRGNAMTPEVTGRVSRW